MRVCKKRDSQSEIDWRQETWCNVQTHLVTLGGSGSSNRRRSIEGCAVPEQEVMDSRIRQVLAVWMINARGEIVETGH